jgi:hypothetical protein
MRKAVVVAVLLAGVGWWFWGRTLEPVRVIRAQLAAISKEDYTQAYGFLSTPAKGRLTIQDFEALCRKNSSVMKSLDSTFFSRSIENNTATISGSLTGLDGRVSEVEYTLVKEGDRWVIESFRW